MFDVGMSEMIILAVIALIAIGPKQLPEVAAKVARFINDFKRVTAEFTNEFTRVRDTTQDAVRETLTQTQKEIEKSLQDQPTLTTPPVDDHHQGEQLELEHQGHKGDSGNS